MELIKNTITNEQLLSEIDKIDEELNKEYKEIKILKEKRKDLMNILLDRFRSKTY